MDDLIREMDHTLPYVVWDVRLPRILTAAAVGMGLALSGTVFQGLLLNPLADPYTLGVSAGAAFGASVALVFGLHGMLAVPASAFLGAGLTLAAVIALSATEGGIHRHNLILSGVIVAAILSAGLSFMKYLADEKVAAIIFWLMGSFVSRTWLDVGVTWLVTLLGLAVAVYYARDLNVMALGERSATALGVQTSRVRLILLCTASLVTAVCVSVSGIIGFVGLIVPHLMRFFTGPDNRILVPISALGGAVLLLAADTVTRVYLPGEIPIGVLTALIGGPVFCYIFRRQHMRRDHD
jgi:iron complex transport system permease protein